MLDARLRGQPTPILVMPDALWSAASLWAGTRAWTNAFRAAGMAGGHGLLCALPAGPAFVQVLLACLWEEITFVSLPMNADIDTEVSALDARAVVVTAPVVQLGTAGVFVPDAASQPPSELPVLRGVGRGEAPHVALRLPDRDADGVATWRDWSGDELFTWLQRHRDLFPEVGGRVLSVLPWHEPDGLLLGLLGALLHADEIVRERSGGTDADAIDRAMREHGTMHLDSDMARAGRRFR